MLVHLIAMATVIAFGGCSTAVFTRHCWLLWKAGNAELLSEAEASNG